MVCGKGQAAAERNSLLGLDFFFIFWQRIFFPIPHWVDDHLVGESTTWEPGTPKRSSFVGWKW